MLREHRRQAEAQVPQAGLGRPDPLSPAAGWSKLRAGMLPAAVLVTPVLHALAFPPARYHWLAWIAFVPWFVAVRSSATRRAIAVSCITTLIGSYLVAGWLPRAVANYYGQGLIVGALVFAAVWLLTVAPWVIVFTLSYRRLARGSRVLLPLLAGAAWTGTELGRVHWLVADPFGLLGYTQAGVSTVRQIADITGVYGISFALVAVNAALAEVVLGLASRPRQKQGLLGVMAAPAALTMLLVGYGVLFPWASDPTPSAGTRVAIVQGNLDLGSQWREAFYGRNLDAYMRLTLHALQTTPVPLVVWPEGAMTFFLQDEPSYRATVGTALQQFGAQLVAGGPRAAGSGQRSYYNSAFLVSPRGDLLAWYDKQQLLPFAEYFPLGSIALLRRHFARVREFSPGGPATLLPTVAGRAGVVICNEVMFPGIVAERVREGADYIVNLANDSWLGDPQYAAEAFDMAQMRAVEQRRCLVRASTSGPSAIVDARGQVLAETVPDTAATVAGSIQSSGALSIYGRVGDAFANVCWVVVAVALMVTRRSSDPVRTD